MSATEKSDPQIFPRLTIPDKKKKPSKALGKSSLGRVIANGRLSKIKARGKKKAQWMLEATDSFKYVRIPVNLNPPDAEPPSTLIPKSAIKRLESTSYGLDLKDDGIHAYPASQPDVREVHRLSSHSDADWKPDFDKIAPMTMSRRTL